MPSVDSITCAIAALIVAVSVTVPYLVDAGDRWRRNKTGDGESR